MNTSEIQSSPVQLVDERIGKPLVAKAPSSLLKKLTGDTLWLSVDQFARLGLGFILNAWLARTLSIETFATLALAQASVLFLRQFGSAGLDGILTQELVVQPENAGRLLGTAASIRFVYSVVICVGALWYFWEFTNFGSTSLSLIAVGCLANTLTFTEVFDNHLQAQLKAGIAARLRLVSWVICASLAVATLKLSGRIEHFYIILSGSTLLNGILLWFANRPARADRLLFDKSVAKVLLQLSWPLLVSSVFLALYSRFGQVMLGLLSVPDEVAKFAISSQLVDAWRILPLLIVTSIFPYLIKRRKESQPQFDRGLKTAFGAFFWGSMAICALYLAAIEPVVAFIFGEKYAGAAAITKIQVFSIPFAAWATLISRVLIVERAVTFSIYRHLAGAVAGLGMGWILIPGFGANGAAIATVIAFAWAGFGALFLDRRMRRYGRMIVSSVFDLRTSISLLGRILSGMSCKNALNRTNNR